MSAWLVDPAWRPTWRAPARPYVEKAYAADCTVTCVGGRWVVHLHALLESGPVRRQVSVQPDERRALQAARIIERNVRRLLPVPQPPSLLPAPPPLSCRSSDVARGGR